MRSSEETRTKLMEAAIILFGANGFKGTSIRDIAGATGVTIPNIYHYFGSKSGLLVAIVENASKVLCEELRKAMDTETDPIARFKTLVRTHLTGMITRHSEARLFFFEDDELSPETNEMNRRFQISIVGIYREELRKLRSTGFLKDKNLTILTFHILAVIQWHLRWYRQTGPLSIEKIQEEALSFMFYGMFGTPAFDGER
jgi:TetR/AcrR family transcriptional regulator, cholesterol catabolism regulator